MMTDDKPCQRLSLEEQYAAALDEWEASEDAALWECTVGDGIGEEAEAEADAAQALAEQEATQS